MSVTTLGALYGSASSEHYAEGFEGAEAEFNSTFDEFNPIEKAFAKLKAILRKAAKRTINGLWATIADALNQLSTLECRNYFTACGYDLE